ncbi:MAG TPA: hypothetical protein VN578_21985 [Candidatus Binatia bacterium]|jgi:hypothetical protein|nr:hypothetical protein [Candidatus Binatia bacterium]
MPQNKITIQGIDPYAALKVDVEEFAKKWPDKSLRRLSDVHVLALVQIAIQPLQPFFRKLPGGRRNGKRLHPYCATWFAVLYARWPDFTLAALQFIRSQWSPKKEGSSKAGKSWRIQKFVLTHLYFPPLKERPKATKCFLNMADCEIATGYEYGTGEPVTVGDVKAARKVLAKRINRR